MFAGRGTCHTVFTDNRVAYSQCKSTAKTSRNWADWNECYAVFTMPQLEKFYFEHF